MQGDVVTNVDLREAMEGHKRRRKEDSAAIMTVLLQEVGGWGLDDDDDDDGDGAADENAMENPNAPDNRPRRRNHQLPPLRSSTDDLLLALDATHDNRILLWDSKPRNSTSSIPTIFFQENSSAITLTRNHLDVGIDVCSPDVLARFSDEFDYRELRSQFVANCVAEEEVGLQSRIFGHITKRGEYSGRMGDPRRYHRVSMDLLRRWCYPLVPDNYGHCENGWCSSSYVMERHFVYRASWGKRSHVGRSTRLIGPLLIGPDSSIGERCSLQRSVLGPNCTLIDNCTIKDSHLWGNVLVEEDAWLHGVVVCEGAIIRKGAVVERGCVIGRGCVVGEGIHLKEFTRVTCAAEVEGDDEYSGFDDSSSSGSEMELSSSDGSDSGDEDASEDSYEKVKSSEDVIADVALEKMADLNIATITNYEIVGKDGLGRVYVPSPQDDYDSDDEEEEAQTAAMELMKTQSIGYEMTLIYRKWLKLQVEDVDDGFSLDAMDSDSDDADAMGDGWANDAPVGAGATGNNSNDHLDSDGMQIAGRQRGVDVVRELRDICLDHEMSTPVENLRIELNSFKFSQNATYANCCQGATMAVVEKILEEMGGESISPAKLVASLKKMLEYWGPLFQSLCIGTGEEKAIIRSLENMALGGSGAGSPSRSAGVLGKEPAFRFLLQTLHDREIVNEEAIFEWAAERREESRDSPTSTLFWQQPTQDFLEWLEQDSGSSSEEEDSDGSEEDGD
mmetsp:Transcript_36272/g.77343  ORF Transcript_36272/g.77343 Transcript_36272/m.77343 type:complete len:731 (+) Transcript_36272:807-2999(+)